MAAEAGGLSEATVRAAYLACHTNSVARGTIGIVTLLAILIMVYKVVDIYQKNHTLEGFNRKGFFELIRQYILYMAFIAAFPFVISGVESVLATMQDTISSSYNTSLERSSVQAISEFVKNYQETDDTPTDQQASWADKTIDFVKDNNPLTLFIENIKIQWMTFVVSLYMTCLYILKYIYFFFCAGRYLWLLMLEALAPIALILSLNKTTFHYFSTWLKNMLICYLLIPFFLMADAFSEALVSVLSTGLNLSTYGLFWVIGIIVIKVSLFGMVSKKAHSLI